MPADKKKTIASGTVRCGFVWTGADLEYYPIESDEQHDTEGEPHTMPKARASTTNDPFSSFVFGDAVITLHLPNESHSLISSENVKPFSASAAALISATRAVREQDLFTGVSVEALAKQYSFAPFSYQIENVDKMLTRFEGHGVFGDQVGLGKTAEALMTAHAMFESGTIKNALIVVPEKTLAGWKREIERKFCGIFELVTYEDVAKAASKKATGDEEYPQSPFLAVLYHIWRDNNDTAKGGSRRLYLISSDILQGKGAGDMATYRNEMVYYEILERDATDNEEEQLAKIGAAQTVADLRAALECFTERHISPEDAYDLHDFHRDGEYAYDLLPLSVCRRIIEELEKLKKNIESSQQDLNGMTGDEDERFELVTHALSAYLARLEKKNEESKAGKLLRSLFGHNEKERRLIDLLIVDEIHAYYDDPKAQGANTNVPSYVSLLADIHKKFCILISATPIRKQLRDVYDLLRIARPTLFAHQGAEEPDDTQNAGFAYFCKTFCQLTYRDDVLLLNKLFSNMYIKSSGNKTTINENAGSDFFGLINNFFTRSRIHMVEQYMCRRSDEELVAPGSAERTIIESMRTSIEEMCKLQLSQRGGVRKLSPVERLANYFDNQGKLSESEKRHTRTAIDAVLMQQIELLEDYQCYLYYPKDPPYPQLPLLLYAAATIFVKDQQIPTDLAKKKELVRQTLRLLYEMVDWRRKKKQGILIVPKIEAAALAATDPKTFKPPMPDALITENAQVVPSVLAPKKPSKKDPDVYVLDKDALLRAHNRQLYCHCTDEDALSRYRDFALAYDNAGVIYYLSRYRAYYPVRTHIFDMMTEKLNNANNSYTAHHQRSIDSISAYAENVPDAAKVDSERYDRILLVDSSCQAGINLQEYSNLVLYQLDVAGQRILDPVDIEQWIGRIHRTGQTKTAHIITVLTAHMLPKLCEEMGINNGEGYVAFIKFLKWYYDFLSDPMGLDLFGDNTPDVAFLQPLIHEYVRTHLSNNKDSKESPYANMPLSQLMYIFYKNAINNPDPRFWEEPERFLAEIRAYCSIAGFGKPKKQ